MASKDGILSLLTAFRVINFLPFIKQFLTMLIGRAPLQRVEENFKLIDSIGQVVTPRHRPDGVLRFEAKNLLRKKALVTSPLGTE